MPEYPWETQSKSRQIDPLLLIPKPPSNGGGKGPGNLEGKKQTDTSTDRQSVTSSEGSRNNAKQHHSNKVEGGEPSNPFVPRGSSKSQGGLGEVVKGAVTSPWTWVLGLGASAAETGRRYVQQGQWLYR